MSLSESERKVVGELVRGSLRAALEGGEYVPKDPGIPALEERCGCFVTLKTKRLLRGCLGCFTSSQPLWRTVAQYARSSALEDPRFRFNRLRVEEYPGIEIEVSVLSPLRKCEDPEGIRIGVDGIYVHSDYGSGCFLPQVATEKRWNATEFWEHCCRDKAGLDWDAWLRPDVSLSTFTADVFSV